MWATIVTRLRDRHGGQVPAVSRYDPYERVEGPPLSHLFQHFSNRQSRNTVMSMRDIHLLLDPAETHAHITDAAGEPIRFRPHDFRRRLFATDALAVENYAVATSQIAQTTLRSLLGRADLDNLLAHREDLNSDLRTIIEKQAEPWGIQVRVVEIKDVEIPESMQRAMAREAEAERERRAKVINARGELQASEELRQAAETLSKNPASLQLRYLQTLLELGADHNSTVVFPLPVDIITPFLKTADVLERLSSS